MLYPFALAGLLGPALMIAPPPAPAAGPAAADPVSAEAADPATPAPAEPVTTPAQDEEEAAPDTSWIGSWDLGVSGSSGNSDNFTFGTNFNYGRENERDRWTFNALYSLKEDQGATIERKWNGLAQYDRFLSPTWYLFGMGTLQSDKLAGLDLRSRLGVGGGYNLWKEHEDRSLSFEAGVNYTDEDKNPSEFSNSFWALILGARYSQDFSADFNLSSDLLAYPGLSDSDDLTGTWDTRARYNLSETIYIQGQLFFNYDKSPVLGADELDTLYLISLGWSF